MSAYEIIGYSLLIAGVWHGSDVVSRLAQILGRWLDEPIRVTPAH